MIVTSRVSTLESKQRRTVQQTGLQQYCAGQKKNNNVLCLALYLLEAKYFKEVEVIFYIRGHTKNACDRLFNQMKLCFHKSQVYTYGQALQLLNSVSKQNMPNVDRFVTLSPPTEMARKFHTRNGAFELQHNGETFI